MKKSFVFEPKIIIALRNYRFSSFLNDVGAGVIVGIVALPLAIAFGIASGATPQQGLITAIIGGFLISLLGGSRVQIGGPTGAFIIIVYRIIETIGFNGLLLATFMAGIILIIIGVLRVGTWIKYIPNTIVVGFTSGIALVIFSSQVPSFLGINIDKIPSNFILKWITYFDNLNSVNIWAFVVGLMTISIIILLKKKAPKLPGAFLSLLIVSSICYYFKIPVQTIGTNFGNFSFSFPEMSLPFISFEQIYKCFVPAITIAFLAAIESLLSAVVADGMIGGRHRSNTELIAQGIANIACSIFGGIPATGAIARTATNIKNGGRTPVAGLIHSLTLLLILLIVAPLVKLIPMASLAGILIIVAYGMSEWRHFFKLLKSPRDDLFVLLSTFLLTVIFDLTIAIQAGMIFSVFFFMVKMANVSQINKYRSGKETDKYADKKEYYERGDALSKYDIPDKVEVLEIRGAFFFGASSRFCDIINSLATNSELIIFRFNQLYVLDSSGIDVLYSFIDNSQKNKVRVVFTEVNDKCLAVLKRSFLWSRLGENNIYSSLYSALEDYRNNNTN